MRCFLMMLGLITSLFTKAQQLDNIPVEDISKWTIYFSQKHQWTNYIHYAEDYKKTYGSRHDILFCNQLSASDDSLAIHTAGNWLNELLKKDSSFEPVMYKFVVLSKMGKEQPATTYFLNKAIDLAIKAQNTSFNISLVYNTYLALIKTPEDESKLSFLKTGILNKVDQQRADFIFSLMYLQFYSTFMMYDKEYIQFQKNWHVWIEEKGLYEKLRRELRVLLIRLGKDDEISTQIMRWENALNES
jgi:hypothetical protein